MAQKKAKTVRLGMAGYARLLAILRTGPQSPVEFQSAAGVGHTTAHRILGSMYALGMIHIAGWRMEPESPTQPQFIGFPGSDVAPPAIRPNGRPIDGSRKPRAIKPTSELASFKLLLQTLESPASKDEIMAATGMSAQTVRRAVDALVKWRIARVALWTSRPHPGGAPMPNYQLGSEASAHRPPRTSARDVQRRYLRSRAERERISGLASLATVWRTPAAVLLPDYA